MPRDVDIYSLEAHLNTIYNTTPGWSRTSRAAYAIAWGLQTDRIGDHALKALTSMVESDLWHLCREVSVGELGSDMAEIVRRINVRVWASAA